MSVTIEQLPEPNLLFAKECKVSDPHIGLSLFGPFDDGSSSKPSTISYALIGTETGIAAFQRMAARIQGLILPPSPELIDNQTKPFDVAATYSNTNEDTEDNETVADNRLWPPFPGFSTAFNSTFPTTTEFQYAISAPTIDEFAHDRDQHKRAYQLVGLYLDQISKIAERDERINVIICIIPDIIWLNCRPLSVVRSGATGKSVGKKEALLRQRYGDLFGEFPSDQYDWSNDFRRQIKARSMEHTIPIQLIRESTLTLNDKTENRGLTPLSDRAWNLSTALYYKACGKPWKLADAREGVCYIGLAFRREENASDYSRTACCAAQMFLDSGDGVVFRGEFGPWYSPKEHEFHLSRSEAKNLLAGVINTYRAQGGKSLREVFLHSRSEFDENELAGYQDACPEGVKLVGVVVSGRDSGLRLFRKGKRCVQRGLLWIHSPRLAYLWSSGFKKDLLTYDGSEVPVPLTIRIQFGEADIRQVCKDIFALTKLNYNACKVGDSDPVTVKFSDDVGEILTSNPHLKERKPQFRFYI